MGIIFGPQRYARVPWSEIEQSDLIEQGKPELVRDCRRERHLGLNIKGQYVHSLGILAVRCERYGDDLFPISMAIAPDKWEMPETPAPVPAKPAKRSWIRYDNTIDPGGD